MPGAAYRSISNPRQYEKLRTKGFSKESAAKITNASANHIGKSAFGIEHGLAKADQRHRDTQALAVGTGVAAASVPASYGRGRLAYGRARRSWRAVQASPDIKGSYAPAKAGRLEPYLRNMNRNLRVAGRTQRNMRVGVATTGVLGAATLGSHALHRDRRQLGKAFTWKPDQHPREGDGRFAGGHARELAAQLQQRDEAKKDWEVRAEARLAAANEKAQVRRKKRTQKLAASRAKVERDVRARAKAQGWDAQRHRQELLSARAKRRRKRHAQEAAAAVGVATVGTTAAIGATIVLGHAPTVTAKAIWFAADYAATARQLNGYIANNGEARQLAMGLISGDKKARRVSNLIAPGGVTQPVINYSRAAPVSRLRPAYWTNLSTEMKKRVVTAVIDNADPAHTPQLFRGMHGISEQAVGDTIDFGQMSSFSDTRRVVEQWVGLTAGVHARSHTGTAGIYTVAEKLAPAMKIDQSARRNPMHEWLVRGKFEIVGKTDLTGTGSHFEYHIRPLSEETVSKSAFGVEHAVSKSVARTAAVGATVLAGTAGAGAGAVEAHRRLANRRGARIKPGDPYRHPITSARLHQATNLRAAGDRYTPQIERWKKVEARHYHPGSDSYARMQANGYRSLQASMYQGAHKANAYAIHGRTKARQRSKYLHPKYRERPETIGKRVVLSPDGGPWAGEPRLDEKKSGYDSATLRRDAAPLTLPGQRHPATTRRRYVQRYGTAYREATAARAERRRRRVKKSAFGVDHSQAVVKAGPQPSRRHQAARGAEIGGSVVAGTVGSAFGAAKLRDAYKKDYPKRFAHNVKQVRRGAVRLGASPRTAVKVGRLVRTGGPHFIPLAVGVTAGSIATGGRRYGQHLDRKAKKSQLHKEKTVAKSAFGVDHGEVAKVLNPLRGVKNAVGVTDFLAAGQAAPQAKAVKAAGQEADLGEKLGRFQFRDPAAGPRHAAGGPLTGHVAPTAGPGRALKIGAAVTGGGAAAAGGGYEATTQAKKKQPVGKSAFGVAH